ncbi:triacylglycerol lipase 1 isoform X2 [Physcomitrium patens]|uniref:triacylglycerol lipase 1 isoform X2 n=1 Tax=Physcomitrium patens TaxID=3218 RepID=UPI003CCD649A
MPFVMGERNLLLLCLLLFTVSGRVEGATAFCKQVVEPLGLYDCEEFTVQTDDGFVLVLHRLSRMSWPPSASGRANNATKSSGTPNKHVKRKTVSQQAHEVLAPKHLRDSSIQAPVHSYLMNRSVEGKREPAPLGNNSAAPSRSISSNNHLNPTERKRSRRRSRAPAPRHSSPTRNGTISIPSRTTTPASSSDANYTLHPEAGKNAPVLIMHQEFLNGDSWFQYVDSSHSDRLLPFMLVDDGFDVWIGHQRATYWGHGHVHLKKTDREYWNWTWDQHADYDFPAQLRLISAQTNQPVHVIGVSQSATLGAAGATNQETAQMIRSLTLIGPTAYRGNTNSILLDAWAYYFGAQIDSNYYSTGYQNGAFNFSSSVSLNHKILSVEMPQRRIEFPGSSSNISVTGTTGVVLSLLTGPNCCLGTASIELKMSWDGTTSFKNLLQWQQGIRTNRFARYDYGSAASNYATYGQPTAPNYNLAQIPRRMPVFVIAAGRDWTAPPSGTLTFMQMLQMPALLLNLTNYAHYDLSYSVNRVNDVYLPILRFLEGQEFL